MSRVYLDWNATAPLRDEARAAMLAAMDVAGNPSSVHAEGRAARALVERARAQVAEAVGCKPAEVVFTSGATEAARVLDAPARAGRLTVDPTAHDALWAYAPESTGGAAPNDKGPTMLALGLASGETGIIADVPPRDGDGRLHWGGAAHDLLLLDVTQAIGKIPFSFAWSGADLAILSAHKLGGPKGVGALIVRDGLDIEAIARGGGQELGRRSGTENIVGIAGFGAAIEAALGDLASGVWDRVECTRDNLEAAIEAACDQTIFVGKDGPRLPNTSTFATPGWRGETQVMAMDLAGFAVSAGSACSSGKVRESRVLTALGLPPELAGAALRVSLGPETTETQVAAFAETWGAKWRRIRSRAA